MNDFATSLERVTAAFSRLVDKMRSKRECEKIGTRSCLVGPIPVGPINNPFKISNCEYCQEQKPLFAYAWIPPPSRDDLGRKWFYCDDCATMLRTTHV